MEEALARHDGAAFVCGIARNLDQLLDPHVAGLTSPPPPPPCPTVHIAVTRRAPATGPQARSGAVFCAAVGACAKRLSSACVPATN